MRLLGFGRVLACFGSLRVETGSESGAVTTLHPGPDQDQRAESFPERGGLVTRDSPRSSRAAEGFSRTPGKR